MKMCELSPLEIEKWYAVAVGEIGIPPSDFYEMTEDELRWAYDGYKQRQEDLANMLLLVLIRAQSENGNQPFQFVEDKGYDVSSIEDRRKTFITLGIEEE